MKTGVVDLPLHPGKAPYWLVSRMKKLSHEILDIVIEEYGTEEVLKRLSDPLWFQAFSCCLGYDWHSSGTTTVVCGVLKTVNFEEYGIGVCGGKGKISRKTPSEIEKIGDNFGLKERRIEELKYASRMSAKVDNTCVQDGYQLYHHTFIFTEKNWCVVQQGLNEKKGYARRYQWYSAKDFIEEPQKISGIMEEKVIDVCSRKSKECRDTVLDLVRENPKKLERHFYEIPKNQKTLSEWIEGMKPIATFKFPKRVNWKAIKQVYEFQPKNFEEFVSFQGIGPSTLRGLILVSDLIYSNPPSYKDPVKYSFAYGGKDGVPFPVDRKAMDESCEILKDAVERAKLGNREKLEAISNLKNFLQ